MLGTRTILGLAIDECGAVVAEVGARSGRPEVRRVGQCVFEEKLGPGNGRTLGHTLRQFLRANHFSLKNAAVGIPTKWVVAREVTSPPAGADAVAGLLAIQAERTFSLNAGELIFDYCGRPSTSQSSKVMLLAARRQMIEQIKELTAAAGLRVQSVTVSALALGSVPSSNAREQRYGIYTRPTYCEFWSHADGAPRSIKHVAMPATNGEPGDQAKRLISSLEQLILVSGSQDQTGPHEVILYDDAPLSDGVVDQLRTQIGPRVTVTDGNTVLASSGLLNGDRAGPSGGIAAVAVAVAAAGPQKPAVDFLNPRIGRKKTSPHKRVATWAFLAGVVLLGAAAVVVANWHGKRTDITFFGEQLELIADDVAVARDLRDRLSYAGSWTSRDPRFLECILQLTLAFPESPRVWATSLALSETSEGSLIGRATDEQSFYEVLNNIKQNAAFSDVMMMYLRDAGGSAQEKTFAVTFKFQGVK